MKYQWVVTWGLVLFVSCALGQSEGYQAERRFYERTCQSCHEMKFYLWPRSHKSWELTVARMRGYVNDDTVLSVDGSRRITDFLAAYVAEGQIIVPEGVTYVAAVPDQTKLSMQEPLQTKVEVASAVQAEVALETPLPVDEARQSLVAPEQKTASNAAVPIATAQIKQPPRASVARTIDVNPLKRLWNPDRSALTVARWSGFLAVIALAGLLVSGFGRRKLKLHFRRLHGLLALMLFVSLSVHGMIYIFEYGSPGVLWYWFGFGAFVLLIVAELQGMMRKRFKKGVLLSHIIVGCTGFTFAVLHWAWAWL